MSHDLQPCPAVPREEERAVAASRRVEPGPDPAREMAVAAPPGELSPRRGPEKIRAACISAANVDGTDQQGSYAQGVILIDTLCSTE